MTKKTAQSVIYDQLEAEDFTMEEVLSHGNKGDENNEEIVVLDLPGEKNDFVFTLPSVPGAPDAEDIVIDDEPVQEETEVEVENDPWDWMSGGHANFLPWLMNMMQNCPRHSGYDTTGIEKVISHFEALNKEISKAMRTDYKNVIDVAKAEEARDQIEDGLERLLDRLEQVKTKKYKRYKTKKKSWAESSGLVKEANKTTKIDGIIVTVPLLISRCARVCMNGMITAGHDLEDMFKRQVEEYDLTKREQAELSQLLSDMGFPMRQDRGFPVGQDVDITRSDNFDFAANYSG